MKNFVFISQGIIQIFVGIGAVICGALLICAPSGTLMQMPSDMLKDSPFHNFLIPGIILFLINGVGQLISGVLSFQKHPAAGYGGAIFGIGLMIWIFVQVNMIGGRNILQYTYFLFGVIETSLTFLIFGYLQKIKSKNPPSNG